MFEQLSLGRESFVAYLTFELISFISFLSLLCLLLFFEFGFVQFLLLFLFLFTRCAFLYLCWRLLLICFGSWLWLLDRDLLSFILFVAVVEESVHKVIFIITRAFLLFRLWLCLDLLFLLDLLFDLYLWFFRLRL